MRPFGSPAVEEVFARYPVAIRRRLLKLRELIFSTAAQLDGVGELTETLKWGEPAYLTERSRSGSTVRLGWKSSAPDHCAIYFNCRTTLVETFKTMFPGEFHFEGNRAIVLRVSERLPVDAIEWCLAAALTYRRRTR